MLFYEFNVFTLNYDNVKLKGDIMEHILIVDDMVVNLKTAKYILEDKYKISLVTSGFQALQFLEKNFPELPDLILMDILMPGMDGIATIHKINNIYGAGTIPVIFFTSVADKDTIVECYNAGLKDYIVKPFNPNDMLDKISKVLEREDDD